MDSLMLEEFKVDLNNFTIIGSLGKGAFGSVYLIEHKENKKRFAAKVSQYSSESLQHQKSFLQELKAYSKVKHQAVLSFYGFNMTDFKNQPFPTIITEYMPNGSLDRILKNYSILTPANKYIILYGIAEGMKYLHSMGIIHRDLKPGNILIDKNFYPHICDFGESKISCLWISFIFSTSSAGTPLYMAPEIISEQLYNHKVDTFSFSILAYELLTGKPPFPHYRTLFKVCNAIQKGERPDLTFIESDEIKNMLSKWWSHNPEYRPSFDEIIKFLKQDKVKKAMNVLNNQNVEKYIKLFENNLPSLHSKSSKVPRFNLMEEKNKIFLQHKKDAENGNTFSSFVCGMELMLIFKKQKDIVECTKIQNN